MKECASQIAGLAVLLFLVAFFLIPPVFRRFFKRFTVYEYQKGLRYRRGKLDGLLEPGLYWIYIPAETITAIDGRLRFVSVPGQEIVSSDGVSLKISIAAQYTVSDPVRAVNEVENYIDSLYITLQLCLRDIVQELAIDDIMASRSAISEKLMERSKDKAAELGLTLHSANVKDFMLPGDLKKVFAQVVNARKEGLAALERARGETAALRNLANASALMEKNPALLTLRTIQSLEGSKGNTVIMGMPGGMLPVPVKGKEHEASGDAGASET